MINEKDIEASKLAYELCNRSTDFGSADSYVVLHTALLLITVSCINWEGSKWLGEWVDYYRGGEKVDTAKQLELLNHYVRQRHHKSVSGSVEVSKSKKLYQVISNACESRTYDEKVYLFDHLFYVAASLKLKISREHVSTVAALVNGLKRQMGIFDYFLCSGESFLTEKLYAVEPLHWYATTSGSQFDILVFLRLLIRDVEPKSVVDGNPYDQNLFWLMDVPKQSRDGVTSLTSLAKLLSQEECPEKILVIVDRGDRGGGLEAIKEIRETVFEFDMLEAIIDFITYDVHQKPRKYTAWLLNRSKNIPGKTMCVDVSHIPSADHDISVSDAAWFAAAVVDLWSSTVQPRRGRYQELMETPLRGYFNSIFSNGSKSRPIEYKDEESICVVVNSDEFSKKKISVELHLKRPEAGFSILSTKLVMEQVKQNFPLPILCYIIGNNGAGKSLLLSELVKDLHEIDISTIGVASGAVDRFSPTRTWFTYCGEGKEYRRTQASLGRYLLLTLRKVIYSAELSGVFEKCLGVINFKHRLYLIPEDISDSMLMKPSNARHLISFSHENKNNIKGLQRFSRHRLALVRGEKDNAVSFDKLSSGEQCIILMLAKILAHAQRNGVVLVDEPEVSLHVFWQQMLPQLFEIIAQELCCSFVIATHSPTVIANVKSDMSSCFLARDKSLEVIPPEERHSVETILLEGFKLYTPHNREVSERCAALVSQAIRDTNFSGDLAEEKQYPLLDELQDIRELIEASGNAEDERSKRDIDLVFQAKRAIREIYTLAIEEAR